MKVLFHDLKTTPEFAILSTTWKDNERTIEIRVCSSSQQIHKAQGTMYFNTIEFPPAFIGNGIYQNHFRILAECSRKRLVK